MIELVQTSNSKAEFISVNQKVFSQFIEIVEVTDGPRRQNKVLINLLKHNVFKYLDERQAKIMNLKGCMDEYLTIINKKNEPIKQDILN